MSAEYSEDKLVQKTYAEYFQTDLGWETVFAYNTEVLGPETDPASTLGRTTQAEVILKRHLRAALKRINTLSDGTPYPEATYTRAIETFLDYNPSASLLAINRDKLKLLREGIEATYEDPETKEERTVRLKPIDFDYPESNHFLIVRELWIQGPFATPRRPDILGFVNGIPLLFIELKRHDKNLQTAYDQNLTSYREYIPELFHYNGVCILSNGDRARIGTFASPYSFFNEWKRLAEDQQGRVDFETMLMGIGIKRNFLDLIENFILFDDSSGELTKILARNHQFLGVNLVYDKIQERHQLQAQPNANPEALQASQRLGVFWHTQGSGKSYSMVFLTEKVHRKLGGYAFLIVTDRQELDGQIAETYIGTGAVQATKKGLPNQASSGEDLKLLLQGNQRYVFSLIHKFNQEITDPQGYSPRDNIIVLSDEAHRTQYGKLALNMRQALPNAAFIGFTGTPLMDSAEDQKTKETFGDYVSVYDFQRAIEDGATVPLYYDNRGEKLEIVTDDINERVAEIVEDYALSGEDESRLLKRLGGDYAVITAPNRLDRIAADLVKHFCDRWQTGKAMLVCIDKITTVKMYNLIDKYWKEEIVQQEKVIDRTKRNPDKDEQDLKEQQRKLDWLQETHYRVVISEAADEVKVFSDAGLDIVQHRAVMKKRDLEAEFRKDDHPFRLAIVCAMWLTGFDVPSLSTLYIDKPMRGHTLMQTIARANRVHEGKNNGLLVDYSGILKSFRAALAKYGRAAVPGHTPPEDLPADGADEDKKAPYNPMESLSIKYAEAIQECMKHLNALGFDINKLINAQGIDRLALLAEDGPAMNAICTNDETRIRFEVLVQDVLRKRKALSGRPDFLIPHRSAHDALEALHRQLLARQQSQTDLREIFHRISSEIGGSIQVVETQAPGAASEHIYDLSGINFDLLKTEFAKSSTKQVQVQDLKQAIAQRLEKLLQQNPQSPQRRNLYDRYQEIVSNYNQETDRITIEQTFEELLRLVNDLNEEEKRHIREDLTEPDLALFDILCNYKKGDLKPATRERIKQVAKSLLAKIEQHIANMENWRGTSATRAQVEILIRNHLYSDKTGLPVDEFENDDVDKLINVVFLHVYQHSVDRSSADPLSDRAA